MKEENAEIEEVAGIIDNILIILEMLRALGADHVIDYRKEDFTKCGMRYDLILDVKTNR